MHIFFDLPMLVALVIVDTLTKFAGARWVTALTIAFAVVGYFIPFWGLVSVAVVLVLLILFALANRTEWVFPTNYEVAAGKLALFSVGLAVGAALRHLPSFVS